MRDINNNNNNKHRHRNNNAERERTQKQRSYEGGRSGRQWRDRRSSVRVFVCAGVPRFPPARSFLHTTATGEGVSEHFEMQGARRHVNPRRRTTTPRLRHERSGTGQLQESRGDEGVEEGAPRGEHLKDDPCMNTAATTTHRHTEKLPDVHTHTHVFRLPLFRSPLFTLRLSPPFRQHASHHRWLTAPSTRVSHAPRQHAPCAVTTEGSAAKALRETT